MKQYAADLVSTYLPQNTPVMCLGFGQNHVDNSKFFLYEDAACQGDPSAVANCLLTKPSFLGNKM